MCPFSSLMQVFILLVFLLLVCHALVAKSAQLSLGPKDGTFHMYDPIPIDFHLDNADGAWEDCKIVCDDPHVVAMDKEVWITSSDPSGSFNLTANFLGKTKVSCKTVNSKVQDSIKVTVIRKKRLIDQIFTVSVIILVCIIYINFGCALNWSELKNNITRPIGPVIGFIGQFLIMPLLSFALGKVLFPGSPEMQLGMFFTGVSPAGGASNVWTAVLDGNIDLSITMTTISTFAAFAMMPLWIFTLGKTIFDNGELAVPYQMISQYAILLVVPLGIGFLIIRYIKSVGQKLARFLKISSSILIGCIIVFAIVTNVYIFELFSWQIIVAAMGLPYFGYLLGYIIAKVLKQNPQDCLAIAIETGIQNTGIAIFLLKVGLHQPESDLTTVIPVAVAIMTPFPLLGLYLYRKITERLSTAKHKKLNGIPIADKTEIDIDNNVDDARSVKTIS